MKERTTQVLLAIVAVLLTVHLWKSPAALSQVHAQDASPPKAVLRAESFELVNKAGKVVAQLFAGEDGGGNLRLRSSDGLVRVKLGATADGSGLVLFNQEAEPAVWAASNKSGTSVTLAESGKEKKVLKP